MTTLGTLTADDLGKHIEVTMDSGMVTVRGKLMSISHMHGYQQPMTTFLLKDDRPEGTWKYTKSLPANYLFSFLETTHDEEPAK